MNSQKLSWEQAVTWLIDQPEKKELVRSCYFDRPVLEAAKRYARSPEWTEITQWLPKEASTESDHGKALDLGAGNGIVTYALAKDGWKVSALEPDPSKLVGAGAIRELAQSDNLSIEVVEEFGEAVPFPDNSFDVVVARQVLHHAADLNKMYREISRVLKPGGTLVALRDHVIDSEKGLEVFREKHPLHKLYGGENAYRLKEYEFGMRDAQLEIAKRFLNFDSVLNYAPNSKDDLRIAFSNAGVLTPVKRILISLLQIEILMTLTCWLASRVDRRQGRLVSYICNKKGYVA